MTMVGNGMAYYSKLWHIKCLMICICVTLIFVVFMAVSPITVADNCKCPHLLHAGAKQTSNMFSLSGHRLAILVPFRDRFDELVDFVPHMQEFLKQQEIDHHIFVLNQIDKYRFNRASLINAGFLLVRSKFDYVAMHDVDLLPLNPDLPYKFPALGPFHVASPELHPRYHYPTFVGGILLINCHDFERVNGMSNKYWGWGLEDDEFYVRLRDAGLNVTRPFNITTGTKYTFKHNHNRLRRRRDMAKCYNQQEVTRRRDRLTGLADVKYKLVNKHEMSVDSAFFTLFNIELQCNHKVTPWCECDESSLTRSNQNKKLSMKNPRS